MVSLVSKISFLSCFSFLAFSWGELILRNIKSYKKFSFTIYEPWNLQGHLEFIFKTRQLNTFLAYQDDGSHNFIEIFLKDGKVRLKTVIGDCEMQEVYVGAKFKLNDLHWHCIRVMSKINNFTISVDDTTVILPCSSQKTIKEKRAGGKHLYVANFNPLTALNLNLLAFPGTFHEASSTPFEGCFGDLWITDKKERLKLADVISTKSTEIGCNSSCSTPQLNVCQNQGKCVDDIGRVKCNCLGSGYTGSVCSEFSAYAWFNGSGYIVYNVGRYQPGRSTLRDVIAFRFATNEPWGVIMITDVADDHVIVELENGFLRVSWDLGQGGLVLMSRKGCLHDGTWHTVLIKRTKRRTKITIDDQKPIFAEIPGEFSFLDFKGGKEMIFFGGGPLTKAFYGTRTNYTGYIQQLHFDEFNVINETMHGQIFKLVGDAKFNTSLLFNPLTSTINPSGNCLRKKGHDSEYQCEGNDDEDMCKIDASGTGQDSNDCHSIDDDCSDTDVEKKMRVPTVVFIPPVNNTSSSIITSHILPSPTRTVLPDITKYLNKTQESGFKNSSSKVKNSIRSGRTFIINPSSTIPHMKEYSTIQRNQDWVPRNTSEFRSNISSYTVIRDPWNKPTPATSLFTTADVKNINSSRMKPAPSMKSEAVKPSASASVILKYSAPFNVSYERVNVSAVESAVGILKVNNVWSFGIFLLSLLLMN